MIMGSIGVVGFVQRLPQLPPDVITARLTKFSHMYNVSPTLKVSATTVLRSGNEATLAGCEPHDDS
jgi:hypothetical protein